MHDGSFTALQGERKLVEQIAANDPLLQIITSKGVTVDKKDIDRLLIESLDEVLDDLLGKHVCTMRSTTTLKEPTTLGERMCRSGWVT